MSREEFLTKYWRYYLNIENSVIDLEKYISFDKRNYSCFSEEFIKIIQVICSEIDVMAKLITFEHDMDGYKKFLISDDKYNKIKESKTELQFHKEIVLSPFEFIDQDRGLNWWGDYNKVKHNRQKNDNFTKANLYNVLTSLAALYFLECFYYYNNYFDAENRHNDSMPRPKSKLFNSISNIKDNVVESLEGIVYAEWDD